MTPLTQAERDELARWHNVQSTGDSRNIIRLLAALGAAEAERDYARKVALPQAWADAVACAAERDALKATLSAMTQAVGMLTTLHGSMPIDVNNPIEMATKIVGHVERERDALKAKLAALVEAADRLFKQLGVVHKDERYVSVWRTAQMQSGRQYDGPCYHEELDALLAAIEAAKVQP